MSGLMILATFLAVPVAAQIPEPPGKLVDMGGRKMHIHCTGAGSPTVILEAGASSFSLDWSLVQPEIAKSNRVCSYDRARLGWSDPGGAETASNIVRDLKGLLTTMKEDGPYIMVGASMGGVYVRLFQARHANQVVGMVLVDPVHEYRLYTRYQGKTVPIVSLSAEEYRTVLPTAEVKIPKRRPQMGAPFDRLPEAAYKARILLDQRTIDSYPPSVSAEIVRGHSEAERATFSELYTARQKRPLALGNLPLVMLTRGQDTDKDRQAAYVELASSLSIRTRHTEVPDAGHEIHLYRPDIVADAIREVIALARTR